MKRVFCGRVIFDHIPKTAGQSVNTWLRDSLGTGCVTGNLIGAHRQLIQRFGGIYSVISGHVHFNGEDLDPRYTYITILREPIDRCISWLFYLTETPNGILSEEARAFISSDGQVVGSHLRETIENIYVEHFCRVQSLAKRSLQDKINDAISAMDRYDLIGLHEQMDMFVLNVADMIGISNPKPLPIKNATRQRPRADDISASMRRALIALNAGDIALYQHVQERIYKKRRLPDSNLPFVPYSHPNPYRVYSNMFEILQVITPSTSIQIGSSCIFDIDFSLPVDVDEIIVGIQIFDVDGRLAFGSNTKILGIIFGAFSRGIHRISWEIKADLPVGDYVVGFSFVAQKGSDSIDLAWDDDLARFAIARPATSSVGYAPLRASVNHIATQLTPTGDPEKEMICLLPGAPEVPSGPGKVWALPLVIENGSDFTIASSMSSKLRVHYEWRTEKREVALSSVVDLSSYDPISPRSSSNIAIPITSPDRVGDYFLAIRLYKGSKMIGEESGNYLPVRATDRNILYPFFDARFGSHVGVRRNGAIISSGSPGMLLYGPYCRVARGKYRVVLTGDFFIASSNCWVDIACSQGEKQLAVEVLPNGYTGASTSLLLFLPDDVEDIEIRLWVDRVDCVIIREIFVAPLD